MNNHSTNKKIDNLVLLMAMQDEAQPTIDNLGLVENTTKLNPLLPMRCFQQSVGSINLSIIVSGLDKRYQVDNIGSEAATLMTYEAISQLKPDLIISAGTAGGFATKGAAIGTLYLSEKHFVYHDRHVPLAGFDHSAVGKYPTLPTTRLAKDLNLKSGVISTGSSLEKNDKDITVIEQHDAVAKEMEAAAVAWVAMLMDTPMFALKSITNLVDQDNQSEHEFVKHFNQASQSLTQKILELVDYLQNKTLQDLIE